MASTQLAFTLRTSPNCRTVHLLGSWDAYRGQLPLSKDSSTSKPGSWKGTFRFQGATLQPGQRYWYYYIMDGHHASHDPAETAVVEPTTGRKLNVLDVPGGGSSRSSATTSSSSRTKRDSRRYSQDVPHGRGLSPSKIHSPRPQKPHATRSITSSKKSDIDELSRRFASTRVSPSSFSSSSDDGSSEDSDSEIDSDVSSTLPSLSSGSRSPTSSMSSNSSRGSPVSRCVCDRWGTTRGGQRVRMDCGGSKCGSDDSSEGEYYRKSSRSSGSGGKRVTSGTVYRTARR
ncbi:MAG: hypothetical protein M1828_001724 [Chrysothrix sp. TS-e1954]|nr:MAG: hypothetical protein M1828_001724 [Chrysothrix sp. TS-e1954]